MRIGIGYDAHRLVEKRGLILGGVNVPYEKGLDGHSDADVLVHALIDALLGAAALGDIGGMFPDSDMKYKNISSMKLLNDVNTVISREYTIINIDSVIIAQAPKLKPYTAEMSQSIAAVLGIPINRVNVKAKTEEGMGYTGAGEGIKAQVVCLLEEKQNIN